MQQRPRSVRPEKKVADAVAQTSATKAEAAVDSTRIVTDTNRAKTPRTPHQSHKTTEVVMTEKVIDMTEESAAEKEN